MRAIINSNKHIVQEGIDEVMAGTIKNLQIVIAVAEPNTSNSDEVEQGSIIKAVYVEMWLLAGSQQPGSVTVTLEKVIASSTAMTFGASALLYNYANKKNILFTSQGLTPDANGNPVPFIRQWMKIPKGKQRFGLNDKLVFNISANLENVTFCGLYIYKEYR